MAALPTHTASTNPFKTSQPQIHPKDSPKEEWEDWDADSDQDNLIDLSSPNPQARSSRKSSYRPASNRLTQQRPVHLLRAKSRARQKAKIAQANIKLVTDMSQFDLARAAAIQRGVGTTNGTRFVDAAALRALEGSPNSASMGSFAWLTKKNGSVRGKKSLISATEYSSADLSPDARPIVIGLSVPSDDVGSHQVSPQTAVVETPVDMRVFTRKANGKTSTPQQMQSVWSPDTEYSESPYSVRRPVSSVYSQYTQYGGSKTVVDAPPVPALPLNINVQFIEKQQEPNDEDIGTPYTPFEEDDTPVVTTKSQKLKAATASPGSASSRAHGWWDTVITPFTPQANNPFKTQPEEPTSSSTSAPRDWWSGRDEKKSFSSRASHLTVITPASQGTSSASASDAITAAPTREFPEQSHSEKARVLVEENQASDAPPPYEYSKPHEEEKFVTPQIFVSQQPIPSPGPITLGLAATMTSQKGAANLAEIPLTPFEVRSVPNAVLPNRPIGSYKTGDHFQEARGNANKSERQRRRHEKEDVAARKVGGFWRGRGCVPEEGCFGRTGREGRKRRRVCLGIFGGVIAAIILIVVLVVVLTRRAMSPVPIADTPENQNSPSPLPTTPPPPPPLEIKYWLNLTEFPPMPTGVLTVTAPNNSVAVSGCLEESTASTAWSCSLPKEKHNTVAPHAPNQPEFVFQIQYDNSSRTLWKLADKAREPGSDHQGYVYDAGFEPNPVPPTLEEIKFLGNTTDDIKSKRKEGEPTPFFISLLQSVNDTVGPDMLTKREGGNAIGGSGGNGTDQPNFSDSLPDPKLNPDGTGAPARLFPLPVQQPVRLFDRGLPTQHYGFYTYFDKSIYMANATKKTSEDKNGGVVISNATSIVTFAQTRFLVKIWTQLDNNAAHLLDTRGPSFKDGEPSPMPYPVTIIEDMHGGDQSAKMDYLFPVQKNKKIDRKGGRGVIADIGFGGTLVNGRVDGGDISLGGIDGGTGGCKCEWVNFE